MQHEFEPQHVSMRDALSWFKSAYQLILRRPHYFIVPVLPAALFPGEWFDYFLLLPIYFLLIFTLQLSISEAVDNSQPLDPRRLWQQLVHCLGLNAGLALGMLVLRGGVMALVLLGYTPPLIQDTNIELGPVWMGNIHEMASCSMILLIFLQYIHGWFRHSLRLFHELPAQLAKHLSRKAAILNFFVIWQIAISVLLVHMIAFFTPLWVEFAIKSVLLLIFPPYLYIAYRHIFLGKKDNAPVKVKQPVTVAMPSHG